MIDVFLSYSRKDIGMMQQVRDSLRTSGITVWTDENLVPGTPAWQTAIGKAIENSNSMVVLLSPDSKQSDWVQREISHAQLHGINIVPVLIRGDAKTALPFQINNYQHIDVKADFSSGVQKLLNALQTYLNIKQEKAAESEDEPKRPFPDRYQQRKEFWTQLLEQSREKTSLFSRISPSTDYWISTGAGRTGLSYIYSLYEDHACVELYIDVGDRTRNKQLFESLYEQRDYIQNRFGELLDWQRLNDKQASRIRRTIKGFGGRATPENWRQLQSAMIDAMIRLDRAFHDDIHDLVL